MAPDAEFFLVCNSHIDPVWLWPWEEGVAATLATFRSAAALCEEFEGFVFCHNEALLYQWVEEFDPALFGRIRDLVAIGRWHVMGGWYLQPDCNLPSGESLVRQIVAGKMYFLDRFGVEPTVAVNLDSFGHGRGLVQVLRKAGYDGYLFCRPDNRNLALPADDFLWVGFDGSAVAAHRASEHYNAEFGKARDKVERAIERHPGRRHGLLLWGVGNHGGGPSRQDLVALAALMHQTRTCTIRHARPEEYFDRLRCASPALPRFDRDLNPWGVGCYTSMATVKRQHRRLEEQLFSVEKIASSAALQHLAPYPRRELDAALADLLFCQFHDILAGTSVAEVEAQVLERLGHGLDTVARVRARLFFALLAGQPPAAAGEYPIFVHNPHPFEVDDTVVCEMQPLEPNQDRALFLQPEVTGPDGTPLAVQLEKESCNIQADQRKRLAFRARLAASSTSRFSCRLRLVPRNEVSGHRDADGAGEAAEVASGLFVHRSDRAEMAIDPATGLLVQYRVDGFDYLAAPAARALVMKDSADPWGMKVRAFRDPAGEFRLMPAAAAAAFAGVGRDDLPPVRVIERGPVRTVVEALFEHGRSALCLRYKLPARGTEVEVEARVAWRETDRLLKLSIPTSLRGAGVAGQVAYGTETFDGRSGELVAHRWVTVTSRDGRRAFTVINDATHGFDFEAGELRLSLLRAPAYAGHPVDDVTPIVRQDRYEPRMDQGDHVFRFWLNAGTPEARLEAVDREATARNDRPMALCAFPDGSGVPPLPGILLEDEVVQLAAMKMAEKGDRLILRLFEPTGRSRATRVVIPALDLRLEVALGGFELRTMAIDLSTRRVEETDLLERPLGAGLRARAQGSDPNA